jgi:hypothetical protein
MILTDRAANQGAALAAQAQRRWRVRSATSACCWPPANRAAPFIADRAGTPHRKPRCRPGRDLVDLSWTPWRRIMLSARDNIWTLVDAEDYAWLSEHIWNVWHAGNGRGPGSLRQAQRRAGSAPRCGCIARS